jgi:hypothetical protein
MLIAAVLLSAHDTVAAEPLIGGWPQLGICRQLLATRRRTVSGQHKLKDGALGFVRGNPQPAIMGLNDRTADR